ncbi:MFS transporter [Anaerocolumna sedimenticola]|uniref:MFS transporter n=1 Tax=Anaerocolumna sedimenticola TaxID=2696063 RepID=A0A6P1TUY7_9FIRM|nr:MFS transporter [Anaerocolumna sedimenticola]QHQ63516.1 MFS transporter [Anaerocolumna sedimenticola]
MATILLIIIYIAFISLGLPDSLLGSAWPVMHTELSVPVSFAGIITMIISGGTIISSFFSEKIIRRLGTGKVTAISVFMTGFALLGFYAMPHFIWLCVFAIPLGLGAGSVDSALNNFVALHYKANHMNWLHCFWGIGATAGPFIMSMFLTKTGGWNKGYLTVSVIQIILVVLLFLSLPIWKSFETKTELTQEEKQNATIPMLFGMKGAKAALLSFFCYCAVETTTGLWGGTFLVQHLGLSANTAAKWVSLYYLGITAGRFLSGFLAMKMNNISLIRLGQAICTLGGISLLLPFSKYFSLAGFILIGLGCAPIYPGMLHETPRRFGKEISQAIMGIQMAFAYVGSTFMPPAFGFLSEVTGIIILPFFLLIFIVLMIISSEMINRIAAEQKLS